MPVIRTLKDKEIQANQHAEAQSEPGCGKHCAVGISAVLSHPFLYGTCMDIILWTLGKTFCSRTSTKYILGNPSRELIFLFNWLEMVIDFCIFFHDCFT